MCEREIDEEREREREREMNEGGAFFLIAFFVVAELIREKFLDETKKCE